MQASFHGFSHFSQLSKARCAFTLFEARSLPPVSHVTYIHCMHSLSVRLHFATVAPHLSRGFATSTWACTLEICATCLPFFRKPKTTPTPAWPTMRHWRPPWQPTRPWWICTMSHRTRCAISKNRDICDSACRLCLAQTFSPVSLRVSGTMVRYNGWDSHWMAW